MLIGYARVSTVDQVAGLEAQLRDLAATGCTEKVFSERVSSVAQRDQLAAALGHRLIMPQPNPDGSELD